MLKRQDYRSTECMTGHAIVIVFDEIQEHQWLSRDSFVDTEYAAGKDCPTLLRWAL